jgi:hypothetical protein
MSVRPTQLEYRPLRAPREDGAVLAEPPLEECVGLVEQNVRLAEGQEYDFQGRGLFDLREEARRVLLDDAWAWTTSYRDAARPAQNTGPLLLAGHQPGLFHPGVWMKNFALDWLARRHQGVGVNLLIDSDTVRKTWITVPGGSVAEPVRARVPLDEPGLRVPYEEREVIDGETFSSAGRRALETVRPLVHDPMIDDFWPLADARRRETGKLGAALAQSRHQIEGRWGVATLEVPQSRICQSGPFCWFLAHLLARLPRLWEVYNAAVGEYRRAHRIRSAAHPVPDLHAEDRWLEAPFWIWHAGDPRRRPLFARQQADEIVISDGNGWEAPLPLTAEGEGARAVERLHDLSHSGVKIRCRALITTLWARVVLGDLFIHGIGGAKYDQLTDVLIERFFGLSPPRFLVLSATLHLPIPHNRVDPDEEQEIRQNLRELTYHPEEFLDGVPSNAPHEAARLVREKRRWIETPQTPENARMRCRSIRRVNEALQPYVAGKRRELAARRVEAGRRLRAGKVLDSREYAFCLYPEKALRRLVEVVLPKNA